MTYVLPDSIRGQRGMGVALSAIANVSRTPATPEEVVHMLRTGEGPLAHLCGLFEDVPLQSLMHIAIRHEIASEDLARAYLKAKRGVAAANPELDEWAASLGVDAG
jgi:hypothetical protein